MVGNPAATEGNLEATLPANPAVMVDSPAATVGNPAELCQLLTGLEPVALSVDGECLPHTVIDDLKNILVRFPGPCQVEMHVKHGSTSRRLRFGDGFKVDPHSSLFAELKALLGESSVCQGPAGGASYGNGAGNGHGARNGFGAGK